MTIGLIYFPDNGKEILSINEVMNYLLDASEPLVNPAELDTFKDYTKHEWQDYVDKVRGMIVTMPSWVSSSLDRFLGKKIRPSFT